MGYEPVSFKPLIEELSKHFYVLAYTPPGILQSEPPNKVWGQQDHADLLNSLLNEFEWEEPVIMGQSYGGGIAATYASIYPENTKKIILVDAATTHRADTTMNRFQPVGFSLYQKILSSKLIPFKLKQCFVYQVHSPIEKYLDEEHVSRYKNVVNDGSLVDVEYEKIEVPIMLVWGKQDEITPISVAQDIKARVPSSQLVVVEGGHRVLFENPSMVVKAVVENLGKLELLNQFLGIS